MSKSELTDFGWEVKKRLAEKRMTQNELAEKVGTSKNYLACILHGKRPNSKYVKKIMYILEINLTL